MILDFFFLFISLDGKIEWVPQNHVPRLAAKIGKVGSRGDTFSCQIYGICITHSFVYHLFPCPLSKHPCPPLLLFRIPKALLPGARPALSSRIISYRNSRHKSILLYGALDRGVLISHVDLKKR